MRSTLKCRAKSNAKCQSVRKVVECGSERDANRNSNGHSSPCLTFSGL